VLTHPLVPRRRTVGQNRGLINLVRLLHLRIADVTSGPKWGLVPALFTTMSNDRRCSILALTSRSASRRLPTCAVTACTIV